MIVSAVLSYQRHVGHELLKAGERASVMLLIDTTTACIHKAYISDGSDYARWLPASSYASKDEVLHMARFAYKCAPVLI